jgi:hypothetical protein
METEPIVTALARSAAIRIGRLGTRSTQTPANKLVASIAPVWAASRRPVWADPAPKTNTSASGSASTVTYVPSDEMLRPIHSLRNSS